MSEVGALHTFNFNLAPYHFTSHFFDFRSSTSLASTPSMTSPTTSKHRILLVEDEPNFGIVLKSYLEINGFEIHLCNNGKSGLEAYKLYDFDLCILDVMMPQMDGLTLAKEMRQLNKQVPYIFLTAKGQKEDILAGYKHGADDYLTKPFDTEVLLLKIKAIMKRNNSEEDAVINVADQYRIGQFTFLPEKRTLNIGGKVHVVLSPKEAELMSLLCLHQEHVLTREQALRKIWGEANYFNGRSMDVYLTKLRKYLKEDPQVQITNIHGNGFMLEVKPLDVSVEVVVEPTT